MMSNQNSLHAIEINSTHLGDIPVDRENAGQYIDSIDTFLSNLKGHVKDHKKLTVEDVENLSEAEAERGFPIIPYLLTHSIDDLELPEETIKEIRRDKRIVKLDKEVGHNPNPYAMRKLLLKEWRLLFEIISTGRPTKVDSVKKTATA